MATSTGRESEMLALIERVGDELWTNGDVDAVEELYTEDCVVHSGAETYRGRAEVMQWVLDTHEAFPDLTLELGEIFATDEFGACTWTMTGTHDGYSKLLGLEPTGKAVEMSGVVCARFEDGKIAEEWGQGDQVSLLAQLGVIEPPTA